MEPLDRQEKWVLLASPEDQVSLEPLEPRETLAPLDLKVALDCKDPEENLENLAWLENLD